MSALSERLLGPDSMAGSQPLRGSALRKRLSAPDTSAGSQRPIDARPASILALIPAHNEEEVIAEAITSLRAQSRALDRIIVLADRCADDTERVAAEAGATVVSIEANDGQKAGALNLALRSELSRAEREDAVVVVDADSTIDVDFVDSAMRALESDPQIGAVGGIFYAADPEGNLLQQLQANEYVRYAREIRRCNRSARVITGTGALFRARALLDVSRARDNNALPGGSGVYDTLALTEDNELTLALKSRGWRCVSPAECVVRTDTMPTLRTLWRQRTRWQRGALENLRAHGINRVTAPYALRQLYMGVGIAIWALLGAITIASATTGRFHLVPFWMALTTVFWAERMLTVRKAGPRGLALAAPLVIETVYDFFIMAVYVKAVGGLLLRRQQRWS